MNADISKTIKDRELGELSKIESWDFRNMNADISETLEIENWDFRFKDSGYLGNYQR